MKIIYALSIILFTIGCNSSKNDDSFRKNLLIGVFALNYCDTLDTCFDKMAARSGKGANFQIVKKDGTIVYSRQGSGSQGSLAKTDYAPIFSASKMVTAIVILALIEDTTQSGGLTLETTTSEALGWDSTTAKGRIKLRQLLALTSGLHSTERNGSQASCISTTSSTDSSAKDSCVSSIRDTTGSDQPGDYFVYNSNHMSVAQRMAEKKSGLLWSTGNPNTGIFEKYLAGPSKLNFDLTKAKWYGETRSTASTESSLSGAYGLQLSGEQYLKIVQMVLNDGTYINPDTKSRTVILTSASITELLKDQYETNTKIGYSQFASFGYRWHYGLGNWRHCKEPESSTECDKTLNSHSFGANGFYPWIDRNNNYAAVIAVNIGFGNPLDSALTLFFGEDMKLKIIELVK